MGAELRGPALRVVAMPCLSSIASTEHVYFTQHKAYTTERNIYMYIVK